jgi:hypothetical protein
MFWVTAGGARTQQTSSAMVSRERNRSGTNAGGAGGDLMLADLGTPKTETPPFHLLRPTAKRGPGEFQASLFLVSLSCANLVHP